MKIHITINTFERQEQLNDLLRSIYIAKLPESSIDITIWNDGSKEDYDFDKKYLDKFFIEKFYVEHHGKEKYWNLINRNFQNLYNSNYDFYYHLDDDDTVGLSFFSKSIDTWERIEDRNKISLSLDLLKFDTKRFETIVKYGTFEVFRTKLMSSNFMCEKKFFETLDWSIEPINIWDNDILATDGVSQKISERLLRKNWTMYNANSSLIYIKNPNVSIMNPILRMKSPKNQLYK